MIVTESLITWTLYAKFGRDMGDLHQYSEFPVFSMPFYVPHLTRACNALAFTARGGQVLGL